MLHKILAALFGIKPVQQKPRRFSCTGWYYENGEIVFHNQIWIDKE